MYTISCKASYVIIKSSFFFFSLQYYAFQTMTAERPGTAQFVSSTPRVGQGAAGPAGPVPSPVREMSFAQQVTSVRLA